MKKSSFNLFIILALFSFSACANSLSETLEMLKSPNLDGNKKDRILGKLIKNRLESYHFSKKKINDATSEKAFDMYLKKMDYQKRFFLKGDVDMLSKHRKHIDDQVIDGNLVLSQEGEKIYHERVREVMAYSEEVFKTPFDFKKDEALELDPDKRDFVHTKKDQKDLWRRILKLDALNRFVDLKNEQDPNYKGKKKDKKKAKKKKKNTKKLSYAEMEKKAREETAKSYRRVFKRMMKDDHQDELEKIFNAVTLTFDPHTVYLPPRNKENFNIDIKGSLEGIGALLKEDGDYIKVSEVIPGSASWKQGDLKADFVILKVAQGTKEPIDIVGMRVEEAVQYIRGKKGTEVRLTCKTPDGDIKVVPIIRDTVVIEETYVKSAVIDDKKTNTKTGYILVPKFYRDFSKSINDETARNVTTDVKRALEALKKSGVSGVILDLRNNGGGSLEDARMMSGLFIKEGPIVQIKSSLGQVEKLVDNDPSITYNGPLVVLQNSYSASASEIVAGALQDYKRAIVVGGEKSHGKGTVQTLIDLNQGIIPLMHKKDVMGSLKLTISKFYRVSGGSTQYKGIVPDIIVPDPYSYVDSGESSLDYSLPWDEVKPANYVEWQGPKYNKNSLRKNSAKRVAASGKFKKIKETVGLLKKRKDETSVTLNLDKSVAKSKKYEKLLEKLKYDEEENKNIKVSFSHINDGPKLTDKRMKEEQKKKNDEFSKSLRIDPYIEESIMILQDMKSPKVVSSGGGKKKGFFSKLFGN